MKQLLLAAVLSSLACSAQSATVLVDFENLPPGNAFQGLSYGNYSGIDLGGVVFTAGANPIVAVHTLPGSKGIRNWHGFYNSTFPDQLLRADFTAPFVTSVSVQLGDGFLGEELGDLDNLVLAGYDIYDALIAYSELTIFNEYNEYLYLTINAPNIHHVQFGGIDSQGRNTVNADNFSYSYTAPISPVPLPASVLFLIAALAMLAVHKRWHHGSQGLLT